MPCRAPRSGNGAGTEQQQTGFPSRFFILPPDMTKGHFIDLVSNANKTQDDASRKLWIETHRATNVASYE
jgi:hypothetical protein